MSNLIAITFATTEQFDLLTGRLGTFTGDEEAIEDNLHFASAEEFHAFDAEMDAAKAAKGRTLAAPAGVWELVATLAEQGAEDAADNARYYKKHVGMGQLVKDALKTEKLWDEVRALIEAAVEA